MKKTVLKLLAILAYMILFCTVTGFQAGVLFDFRQFLLVITGTAVLSLTAYHKSIKWIEYRQSASYYATVVGYLTTFLYFFGSLYTMQEWEMTQAALNIRPLFYGFVLSILVKPETPKEEGAKTQNTAQDAMPDTAQNRIQNMPQDASKVLADEEWAEKLRAQGLTAREREVAVYIRNGYSNQEIADKLYISAATVKKHTSSIYEKLQISGREQLKVYF